MIGNVWQSTTPNIIKSNELNADVDGKFTNNAISPPVITQVFSDRLTDSSNRYLYGNCRVHLVIDTVNPVIAQFVDNGFSTI